MGIFRRAWTQFQEAIAPGRRGRDYFLLVLGIPIGLIGNYLYDQLAGPMQVDVRVPPALELVYLNSDYNLGGVLRLGIGGVTEEWKGRLSCALEMAPDPAIAEAKADPACGDIVFRITDKPFPEAGGVLPAPLAQRAIPFTVIVRDENGRDIAVLADALNISNSIDAELRAGAQIVRPGDVFGVKVELRGTVLGPDFRCAWQQDDVAKSFRVRPLRDNGCEAEATFMPEGHWLEQMQKGNRGSEYLSVDIYDSHGRVFEEKSEQIRVSVE